MDKLAPSLTWLNEPTKWTTKKNDLTVIANPHTDFWRFTRHGNIADNGHFFYHDAQDDFSASVRISATYITRYDQAGLMLRINERTWLKCGVEYVNDKAYASAVVTRDFSDWSMVPLQNQGIVEGVPILFRIARIADTVEVSFSADDQPYVMFRQCYFTTNPILQLGMMCASPAGKGFEVAFSDYNVQQLPKLNQSS